MADHIRKLIRQNVVARLVVAQTAAGDRVYNSRFNPLGDGELPCLNVLTLAENTDGQFDETRKIYKRNLDLVVEVAVSAALGPDADSVADLDDLCLQVEAVVLDDERHGQNADDTEYESTVIGNNGDGAVDIALARMTFEVIYHLDDNDADPENLDDFLRAGIEMESDSADGPVDPSKSINIRE